MPSRTRPLVRAAALGAALAALAVPGIAHDAPTSVRGRDTLIALIDAPGETDQFGVFLLAGDRLTVRVKDAAPERGVKSSLALTGPDGAPVAATITRNGTTKPALTFTAGTAGDHVLTVAGGPGDFSGSTGNYSVQFVVKRAKPGAGKFEGAAAGTISYTFGATDGASVVLTASTKKGGFDLTGLERPDGTDEPGFAGALKAAANRRKATVKKLVLTGGNGTYELRGAFDAGSSVSVKAIVTHAEKARKRPLGEEPRFDPLLTPFPAEGIVGTMLHVVGTGFTYIDTPGAGDDVFPAFFIGTIPVPRATIDRPNGALYRFPAPAGLVAGQSYDITVVNADGQSAVADDAFSVVSPPVATGISAMDGGPVAAGPAGGRHLRISGTNFRSGSTVLFGATPTQPALTLPGRIDVTAPPHVAGDVTITIRDEYGQIATIPGAFTYLDIPANALASTDPAFLQALGGETITVTGTDFGDDSTFSLDGADLAVTRISPTTVRFTSPEHADGTGVLRVADAYEQVSTLGVPVKGFSDRTSTQMPAPVTTANGIDGFRTTRIVTGDVNGDGRKDLVLLQSAAAFGSTAQRSRTRLLLTNSNGSFQDVTATAIPAVSGDEDWRARDAALADLDGDGDLDLVLLTDGQVASGARSSLRILQNDGSGGFGTDKTTAWAPALSGYGDLNQGVAIAAVNVDSGLSDTDIDLVITHTGFFTETVVEIIDPGDPGAVPPVPPVIETTVTHFPATRVLRNDGTGKLTRVADALPAVSDTDAQQWEGSAMVAGDLDGDAVPDLVLTSDAVIEHPQGTFLRTARVLLGDGSGGFADASAASLPAASDPEYFQGDRLVLADADGDSDLDLFILSNQALTSPSNGAVATTPALRLLTNSGGVFTAAGASVFPAKEGNDVLQSEGLAVGDLDGDGAADLVLVSARAPDAGGRATRILRRSGSAWVSASLAMPNPLTDDDGHGSDVVLLDLAGDGDLDVILGRDDSDESVRNTRVLVNQRR